MRGNSVFRRFVHRRALWSSGSIPSSSRLCGEASISTPMNVSSYPPSFPIKSLFSNDFSTATRNRFSSPSMQFQRTLCSSSGSSNVVLVKSEEQFNSSMKNVEENSLPAIFYFTAVWCGPCKFISPILEEKTKNYPDVTTYKIDIDQEGLGGILSKLSIGAVPTFHLFQNGKKAAEIVGADVERLKDTVEELYGKD
ncbi:thioredoxin O2, mitochondrial-like [Euphorbia lathyris]|uniref:thioredoxin O2, mitochondrial-like n=1 Tax=Euphorbia lathyris TaxID=212925 RepID=UPI003313F567